MKKIEVQKEQIELEKAKEDNLSNLQNQLIKTNNMLLKKLFIGM